MSTLTIVLILSLIFILSFAVTTVMMMSYKRCPPDKVMVIYGVMGKNNDGTECTAKYVHGGAKFVWPFIQSHAYLDLTPFTVTVDLVKEQLSEKFNNRKAISFRAGISPDPALLPKAGERLLGLKKEEIQNIAEDIITGQLRLFCENSDTCGDKFLEALSSAVNAEINKTGLMLISIV